MNYRQYYTYCIEVNEQASYLNCLIVAFESLVILNCHFSSALYITHKNSKYFNWIHAYVLIIYF